MKRVLVCWALTLAVGVAIQAQEPAVSGHVVIQAPEVKWGAAQTLEKGASFAVNYVNPADDPRTRQAPAK